MAQVALEAFRVAADQAAEQEIRTTAADGSVSVTPVAIAEAVAAMAEVVVVMAAEVAVINPSESRKPL